MLSRILNSAQLGSCFTAEYFHCLNTHQWVEENWESSGQTSNSKPPLAATPPTSTLLSLCVLSPDFFFSGPQCPIQHQSRPVHKVWDNKTSFLLIGREEQKLCATAVQRSTPPEVQLCQWRVFTPERIPMWTGSLFRASSLHWGHPAILGKKKVRLFERIPRISNENNLVCNGDTKNPQKKKKKKKIK